MSERSVKVNIAGRVYPLTVDENEEKGVLEAAGKINERIQQLEQAYGVRDKQDLLAMAALQFATQYLDVHIKTSEDQSLISEKLIRLEDLLDQIISPKSVSV